LLVYMDFGNLVLGSHWAKELLDAAANSMVFVPVLSRSYTSRFWCMLELDLALHGHQKKQDDGDQSASRPLVIPVFYDSPKDIKAQHWAGDAVQQRIESLGREWAREVDMRRWQDNATNIKLRVDDRFSLGARALDKDGVYQVAKKVVEAAATRISPPADGVVGFEVQEAALAAELDEGRLGLWLYGQGGS
jgi:TIR domain